MLRESGKKVETWVGKLVCRPISNQASSSFFLGCGGLSPLGTSATNWPIVPLPDDRWWVWSSRWKENWQGITKYSKKSAPVPLCPPQIPHDLTRARTRTIAEGSRRLTAWAMARPRYLPNPSQKSCGFRLLGRSLRVFWYIGTKVLGKLRRTPLQLLLP
jgi:hypothetical protein